LQPIGKYIESWNIRHSDLVLSINEGLREYTIRMGAVREKTDVIRAGIDLEKYDPEKVQGDEIRRYYGIGKEDTVLFFMGWLYHFSGLQEVATSLAHIKDQYPNLKFLIVGDGDVFEDLKKLRQELHLEDRMILAGKQPFNKVPEFIAAADICLLPAHDNEIMHDIVPIKMYEYMAMGKPIVATRLYGVMTEFGEGNGLNYCDNPKQCMKTVLDMIDRKMLNYEGEKARRFVKGNSWNDITDLFEKTVEVLI
jgi:glycosyltransferase involved in cell wall biosynthesis